MDIKNLVTKNDTEVLDAKIESFKQDIVQQHHLDIEGEEFLEYLVAKSMKLGELYERKRWQEAQAQAPEANALLNATLDAVQKLGSGDFVLVPREPTDVMIKAGYQHCEPNGILPHSFYKAMIEAAEKEMGETREQSHD